MYKFKEQIEKELGRIDDLQNAIRPFDKTLLHGALAGRLRKDGRVSVYLVDSSTDGGMRKRKRVLLGTESDPLVREMAEARYLAKLESDLEHDRKLLSGMLREYRPYGPEDIFGSLPAFYEEVVLSGKAPRISRRSAADRREGNGGSENTKEYSNRHITVDGEAVRSKNEALIYNLYCSNNIRPAYERRLELVNEAGITVYVFPDFTIDKADGRVVIHEHLGMLNDMRYRTNFSEKLGLYLHNGFVLWDDLFITADGPNNSIDTAAIDQMIRSFIVPRTAYY